MKRCDGCIFWELLYEYTKECGGKAYKLTHADDRCGGCHRYPKQLDSAFTKIWEAQHDEGSEAHHGCWQYPLMKGHDWCGEFQKDK